MFVIVIGFIVFMYKEGGVNKNYEDELFGKVLVGLSLLCDGFSGATQVNSVKLFPCLNFQLQSILGTNQSFISPHSRTNDGGCQFLEFPFNDSHFGIHGPTVRFYWVRKKAPINHVPSSFIRNISCARSIFHLHDDYEFRFTFE